MSAHPSDTSFNAALRECALDELRKRGHEIRHIDLYAEGFDPVFTPYERVNHTVGPEEKLSQLPELTSHVDALRWCETVVFAYPTWWTGQPAILKGWFDRVLMKGVAWDLPTRRARLSPMLANIRRVVVITTHGSSKLINALQGESGKRTILRSVRLMFNWRTRCTWIGFYGLDRATADERARMLNQVRRRIRRVL